MGTYIDMNKICRICLEEGSLTSIYNHEYAVSPAEMIHFCSTIKISNDDGLPLSICSNCVYRLRITYEFVQQCETSDMRLKQYVRYELDINQPTLNNNIGKEDNHNNLRTPLIDADNDATLREKNEIYAAMNVVCEFLGNTHNNENNEMFLRSHNPNIEKHNSSTEHHNCLLGVTNNVISSNNNVSNNINDNNNDNNIIINNSNNNNEIIESTYLMSNVLAESILNNTRKLNVIPDQHEQDLNTVDECAPEVKINIGKRMKRKITKKRNICPLKSKADLDKFLAQKKYKKKSQKLSHATKVKMLPVRERLKMPDKCLDCGKTFSYSGYLESHMRTHTGERPYHCEQCNLKFSQAGNLALHMRVHTGERPYQCEICSNLFTTSSNLKAHQRIHSEIRDFKCTQCHRAFKSVTELQSHEGTHTGVKNHICGICGKAFYKTSYMNVHIRTVHIGEKKHRCSECGKVFSNSSNLTCHFRIHTGEKPFSCKICDARFNQSSALIRHTKQHIKGLTKKQFKISSMNSNGNDQIQQDDEQPIQTLLQDIHSTSITDYHHQHEYNKLLSSNDTTFTTNYFKYSDSSVVTSVAESLPSFTKNCVEYSSFG